MTVRIIEKSEAGRIAGIADEIWHEHFTPIIGASQVEYMLAKFQSEKAIEDYIEKGYTYCIFEADGEDAGYMGFNVESDCIFLSKLYVKKSFRRRNIAKTALSYIEESAKESSIGSIYLTVNKENQIAISAYKALGFVVEKESRTDIGNGFYMDDYIMRKIF